jgi:protein-S-isoprenylcysteine O-methyltransferase Ste14
MHFYSEPEMTEAALHTYLSWGLICTGLVTFIVLFFITAPYGRHYTNQGWGPKIPNRPAWVLMEAPSVIVFAFVYCQGDQASNLAPLALLALWQLHYVHRTFIFPFRLKTSGKHMPALVMLLGMSFNTLNAYLNARWISAFGHYDSQWVLSLPFWIGVILFVIGFVINIQSDSILINLRKPGETGYKIPKGGLYEWVSTPSYLGELLEWLGFAIATWSLSGLAFFIFTAANLIPRAVSNHRWYQENFENYPSKRKRLLPYIF